MTLQANDYHQTLLDFGWFASTVGEAGLLTAQAIRQGRVVNVSGPTVLSCLARLFEACKKVGDA